MCSSDSGRDSSDWDDLKSRVVELEVTPEHSGMRLDRFLAHVVDSIGRASADRLCKKGAVLVDQRARPKSYLVTDGQRVVVHMGAHGAALPAPHLDISIVLERPDLVVADKPAGIPCGALLDKEENTLAGALLHRYPEMVGVGRTPREPGLVNRIDNETSGLVLAARTKESFAGLQAALSAGNLEKEYWAFVVPGILPDRGEVQGYLAPHPGGGARVVVSERGHFAQTQFQVHQRSARADQVLLRVHTAYRHQIRCHMSHLGAPLLGDALYGRVDPELGSRHALHASYIKGAAAGVPSFEARSPLPSDLSGLT